MHSERALSRRITHRNKYETTYAPKVTQSAIYQKYDTVNTILNTAAKNPLRASTYFYNPRSPLRARSALRSIVFMQLPLTAPPDFRLATLRASLR